MKCPHCGAREVLEIVRTGGTIRYGCGVCDRMWVELNTGALILALTVLAVLFLAGVGLRVVINHLISIAK